MVLCISISLFRGFQIPPRRFFIGLFNANTIFIHNP